MLFLRNESHDVTHLHEEGLDRLDDATILAKARDEDRILLTHDLDFGDLVAATGARLPSVVVFRLRNMRPDRVNRWLQQLMAQHGAVLSKGAIASVTEGRVRVRTLPLQRSDLNQ